MDALALAPALGVDVAATVGRALHALRRAAAVRVQAAWRRHRARRRHRAWRDGPLGLWLERLEELAGPALAGDTDRVHFVGRSWDLATRRWVVV